jgi:hypothetical protein
VTPPVARCREPLARDPERRRALLERESFSDAAARGLVGTVRRCQKDRPEAAIRTTSHTRTRWCSPADCLAAAGRSPDPAEGGTYPVRLPPEALAYPAAARAAGGGP